MSTNTCNVSNAVEALDELVKVLDQAYWEASSIDKKDTIYDIIHVVLLELTELSKISAQDHDFAYEPITHEIKIVVNKLSYLRKNLDEIARRTQTAERLDKAIFNAMALHERY